MLNRLFGNYLCDKKMIALEQLDGLLPVSQNIKAEIETIIVINKVLSPTLVQELLNNANATKKTVGDTAVISGYLSEEKMEQLMLYQTNSFMRLIQALLDNKILALEQINSLLDEFQEINDFTDVQMSALIHDDVEQCVGIFAPIKSPQLKELTLTLVQTLRRLIDIDMYLEKAYTTRSYRLERYASQMIIGDMHVKFYLSAPEDGLLAIANYFTDDKYQTITNDALDNVGEFINCVNGLFATNLSYDDISVDMTSPDYSLDGTFINNDKLYVLPIHANGYKVDAVIEVYN